MTPQLMTPVCSADPSVNDNLSSPQVFSSTPSGSKGFELHPRVLSDDYLPVQKRRRQVLDDVSDDESAGGSTVILHSEEAVDEVEVIVSSKKFKAVKEEDDAIPLPNPFPLPNHYSSEVETALKLGRLCNVTRQDFIARIASLMLNYKRYPSSEDYANVGQAIIMKYPFLSHLLVYLLYVFIF